MERDANAAYNDLANISADLIHFVDDEHIRKCRDFIRQAMDELEFILDDPSDV